MVIAEISGVRTNQDTPSQLICVRCAAKEKCTDAMTDCCQLSIRISSSKPRNCSPTIVLGPIFNRGNEATKACGTRSSYASVVIDECRNAGLGKKFRKQPIAGRRNSSATVYDCYGCGMPLLFGFEEETGKTESV
jgi:hypothetical protein